MVPIASAGNMNPDKKSLEKTVSAPGGPAIKAKSVRFQDVEQRLSILEKTSKNQKDGNKDEELEALSKSQLKN